MSAVAEVHSQVNTTRLLCGIPVRNLWLLMLYASDLYRHLDTRKVAVEDNPEDIADLVAEILCHHVEERLRRNLSYGYKSEVAIISRVRGRIDTLTTECQRLLERGKICCKFDEMTIDTPRNRYVRAALECLTSPGINAAPENKHECGRLALSLERLGVSKGKPVNYSGKSERFGRHDTGDQKMIAAADLAFSLALPTEFEGLSYLTTPDNQKEWLRKLFEKAIAGFYKVELDKKKWDVNDGRRFNWQISDEKDGKSDGIDEILPGMKTDIIVDRRSPGARLVIDTKFNPITKEGHHRKETLRSNSIYQMYAYLRSQEDEEDATTQSSIGMLLHPAIDEEVTEWVTIQGHTIWFCTVNLGESASSIRERLRLLIDKSFGTEDKAGTRSG